MAAENPRMRSSWLVVAVLVLATPGCSKGPSYRSNFAALRFADASLLTTASGAPFAGTLIARDQEIRTVGRAVLSGTALERVLDTDTTGLVLVMRVVGGRPDGLATLFVDLDAPTLHPAVARQDRAKLALARAASERCVPEA
jgi:hypothetical protein